MIFPLKQYIITQKFGETITDPQGHTGIDLYQPAGTPVYAADGGDILCAGIINNSYGNPNYGNCVLIDHKNGLYTFYAHMDSVKVKTGMGVLQGTQIGTVGTTGNVTGAHLHFEIRSSPIWNRCNFIDPMQKLCYNTPYNYPSINLPSFHCGDEGVVANSILNIREEAGYCGAQLGQIYGGTKIKITGEKIKKDGLEWYPVTLECYVAAFEGDIPLLKPIK